MDEAGIPPRQFRRRRNSRPSWTLRDPHARDWYASTSKRAMAEVVRELATDALVARRGGKAATWLGVVRRVEQHLYDRGVI